MNNAGGADLLVRARTALLDALDALRDQQHAVVVIGAQAIYLHTGGAAIAVAPATKDCDLAVDPRALAGQPRIEEAMRAAGFQLDPDSRQPGAWISLDGIPVDLMVPEVLAGSGGSRSVRVPPHSNTAMRRATGLEAAIVDHQLVEVPALDPADNRSITVNVASPAALLVAKLHKIAEREDQPRRLVDKDAHDIYRLFAAVPQDRFAGPLRSLTEDAVAGEATRLALRYLKQLFAEGPEALGSVMAGRAERDIGDPDVVSASVAILSQNLLTAMGWKDV